MVGTVRFRMAIVAAVFSFLIAPSAAFATKVLITINKVSQKMTVEIDGDREFVWPVSTGAPGYDTPSGTYRPFRMEKDHFSKEWDDAPMPHSMFFTSRGHAIHGSMYVKSLGRRASHGCVRLAPANAAKLFSIVSKAGTQNTTIVLKGGFFDQGRFEDFDIGDKTKKLRRKLKKGFYFLGNTLDGSSL